jgi:hypothetical protein
MKFDLSKAEHCYILGYFWADCHFGLCKNNYNFSFEIKTDDFLYIWPILQDIGFLKYTTRVRKNSTKPQSCIRAAKQAEMQFFKEYQFHNKNNGCPLFYKLIENMKPFFIKGFLDGDGSVSLDKNNLFRVGFNGNKNQSWDFLEEYCLSKDIQYALYRKDRKKSHASHTKDHGYSVFEFTNLQNRINLCESLNHINIGLSRKINIYRSFKTNRLESQKTNKSLKQLIL